MNGPSVKTQAVDKYRPLVKCIDRNGNEYFSELSFTEMEELLDKKERVTFSFSGDCVRSAEIIRHRVAEPDEVALAWKMQNLSFWQRKSVEAAKIAFQKHWDYSKPLTESLIDAMIERAKAGKIPWQPTSNGGN